MATPELERMTEVVRTNAPVLKQIGFRKRRHCFNRSTDDGLVHVVCFLMAPKEPPAWTEIPGLRERRYGSFRLDFGVYVPEMTRNGPLRGRWVNEYNCHFRITIGELDGASGGDRWWPLDDPAAGAVAAEALANHGLPWLRQYETHQAVIDALEANGPKPPGTWPAGQLDLADLYRTTGMKGDERRILEQYVNQPIAGGHENYLADYLERTGHHDLVARVPNTR
jgi:hypothetical protein